MDAVPPDVARDVTSDDRADDRAGVELWGVRLVGPAGPDDVLVMRIVICPWPPSELDEVTETIGISDGDEDSASGVVEVSGGDEDVKGGGVDETSDDIIDIDVDGAVDVVGGNDGVIL